MLYSDILSDFYRIHLSWDKASLVNAHVIAAAHHRSLLLSSQNQEVIRYHYPLYLKHLKRLLDVVSRGDFTQARDLSRRGMENASNWLPSRIKEKLLFVNDKPSPNDDELPDPTMFIDMQSPDLRHPPMTPHEFDYLLSISIDASFPEQMINIQFVIV